MVKKLVAIFLLMQVCTNNAFAEELVKMPRLFTHYQHHSQEHKDITNFWDFIHKHYSDHHQADKHSSGHDNEDNDCNLPFKHCDDCSISIHFSTIGSIPNSINANHVIFNIEKTIFNSENNRIESLNPCNIWQPPKIS